MSFDLEQFKKDCLNTESVVDEALGNGPAIASLMSDIALSLTMLDNIKKNIYYNRPVDPEVIQNFDELPREPIDTNPRVLHGIVGIATESGELLEALLNTKGFKGIAGGDLDSVNVLEEIGDICWYISILLDELDSDWETVMSTVITKLKKRYPEKFTSEAAINRDLDSEREVLEDGLS
jgi:NTP pyrophosphatase (non-canonical NTP hydrolase)